MKIKSHFISGNFGHMMLITLMLLSIINLVTQNYIILVSIFSILIVMVSLYMMTVKVNKLMVRDKIATSILKISELILKVDSQSELYQSVLEEILSNVSGADKGSLITIDEYGDLTFEAVVGFNLEATQRLNLRLEDTYLFKSIDDKLPKSIVVKDIGLKNLNYLNDQKIDGLHDVGIDEIKSTVCVPITFDKKLFGLINIDSVTETDFNKDEVELIEYMSNEISKIIRLYKFFEKSIIQSKYDSLTGILNRKSFKLELEDFLSKDVTHEDRIIVLYDLDQLRNINTVHGFDIGDQYIKHFVKGIGKHLYGKEMLSRVDGNEFLLLFLRPEKTLASFEKQCETWFKDNPLLIKNEEIIINYSLGKTICSEETDDIETLLQLASRPLSIKKEIRNNNS